MTDDWDDNTISVLRTEQCNPETKGIASLPTIGILQKINDLDQTVATAVREALPQVALAVELITKKLESGGRLVYAGAGTSGRLGFMDAAECAPTYGTDRVCCVIAGGRDAVFRAKETMEDESDLAAKDFESIGLAANDVLFAIAASGRTPYCIAALDYAAKVGAARVSLSCNRGAIISVHAQIGIELETGPEVVMGSTRMKAGTAEKMVMNMISTAVMIRLGRTWDNLMIKLNCKNQKGRNRAARIFAEATGKSDLAYARKALDNADGSLEIAVLTELTGAAKDEADEALEKCGRYFSKALDLLRANR